MWGFGESVPGLGRCLRDLFILSFPEINPGVIILTDSRG